MKKTIVTKSKRIIYTIIAGILLICSGIIFSIGTLQLIFQFKLRLFTSVMLLIIGFIIYDKVCQRIIRTIYNLLYENYAR